MSQVQGGSSKLLVNRQYQQRLNPHAVVADDRLHLIEITRRAGVAYEHEVRWRLK